MYSEEKERGLAALKERPEDGWLRSLIKPLFEEAMTMPDTPLISPLCLGPGSRFKAGVVQIFHGFEDLITFRAYYMSY